MGLSLAVLAAGRSTRFGALKQVAPVTPGGASLLACTVLDGLRAGFAEVAVVVRDEIAERVDAHLREHLGPDVPVRRVLQPEPLGTAHAVVLAAGALGNPVALGVANGDDLYGPAALDLLHRAARRLADDVGAGGRGALVGYPMRTTLSDRGGVSRGWVRTAGDDGERVVSVEEYLEVRRAGEGMTGRRVAAGAGAGPPAPLPPDAVASMNLWALDRRAVALLAGRLRRWRGSAAAGAPAGGGGVPDAAARAAEFSLAPELDAARERGSLSLRLAGVADGWVGLTFPGDVEAVRRHLATPEMARRYPSPLARALPGAEDGGRPPG